MEVTSKRDHNLHLQNQNTINNTPKQTSSVAVVYYLSRNGLLDHPHFILVPLSSSSSALYLRDVIKRLIVLRGKSMPLQYSWSSKRSYKNGYVWQDLEENDLIHPVNGGEYVLKGSLILQLESPTLLLSSNTNNTSLSKSPDATSSSSSSTAKIPRHRNQSWGGLDLHEYTVYKSEPFNSHVAKPTAADASTQTDEKRRRGSCKSTENEQEELTRDEISPPPSDDSSPETLESLMKADGRLVLPAVDQVGVVDDRTVRECPSGRMRASSVLMSLISCGSISFRDCGVSAIKDHGFSLVSQQQNKITRRLPRGENRTADGELMSDAMMEVENKASSSFAKMALEDKEYFSGSLIETKKDDFVALKRSSSYNDRSSRFKVAEKEEEGAKARCIPRRLKMQTKRDSQAQINDVTLNTTHDGI